jgi:hypothetical protein
MTVAELVAKLQRMPQEWQVEVNDNRGGNVFEIDSIDMFPVLEKEDGYAVVVIQVNVE